VPNIAIVSPVIDIVPVSHGKPIPFKAAPGRGEKEAPRRALHVKGCGVQRIYAAPPGMVARAKTMAD
jgi:hypothetical protein